MLRVYACIVEEHDWRLVLLAGLICLLAAFTAFSIVEQARRAQARRAAWLAAAGFVSGIGIWSTHFIAMLAYEPNLPIGYDPALTLLSVLAAMAIGGAGWWLSLRREAWGPAAAGLVIGGGIGTMHYIGMAAVTLAGRFVWDEAMVVASLAIGMTLAGAAVAVRRRRVTANPDSQPWPAALLLTLAICGLHFTAMGAASIIPDPRLAVPGSAISSGALGGAVTAMALVIMASGFAVVLLDRKLNRRAAEEAQRLRAFADAAIEGLLVVDGDSVVDANASLLALAGYAGAERPATLAEWLPDLASQRQRSDHEAARETRLIRADGSEVAVEVLARPLEWRSRPLEVLAVRDISERKEAAARIAHLAYHDALTGLPNRAVFGDHLERTIAAARDGGEPVAVLCLDLDGFKAVNDLYGHPVGDELLVEAAQRLRSAARGNELVARLGGDEFAVVQVGGEQPLHAGLLAERLLDAIGAPFALGEQIVRVSCSIGIALFPTDASEAADLVKNADMALYRAKAEGRRATCFYESAMDEALRQRRQLESDLRQAIDRNELAVHYQPLADLESGRILGFEALLRWTHATMGAIAPDTFIPLAEESGFIVPLGGWVLREACAEAAGWTPPLKVSVNLSPVQFVHGDLAAEVERTLAETGLAADRLELEITEGLLIKDSDAALSILRRLKALGVQISMDDFGTGYSSLSYFRLFPFDKVKIDQSFVRDMIANPQARAIVRSVIGLGQGLGMPVVAEGVETDEQLAALQAEGCHQVQGYLISRPGPIENFARVLIDRGEAEDGRARATG